MVTIKIMTLWDEMACVLVGTKVLEDSAASVFLEDTFLSLSLQVPQKCY